MNPCLPTTQLQQLSVHFYSPQLDYFKINPRHNIISSVRTSECISKSKNSFFLKKLQYDYHLLKIWKIILCYVWFWKEIKYPELALPTYLAFY